ncbi:lipoyl(octanoyl) transferase LipB [candidate division WOR-3 bacterium]|nr:lipoyl(octanoyl) transferase LipB [candidate division WOR-3 bacterium]
MHYPVNVIDLGIRDYKEVWDLQRILHQKRVDKALEDTLLLVEHDHVFTMGKSGKQENLLVPRPVLEEKGAAYYEIERGGDITYHGPGQLVGYPIMNIKQGLAGIRPYIEHLEDVIIRTLHDFGIEGMVRDKMIGVWTNRGKICSIGVAVKRWVSFHGFALNVNTDLSYFDLIHPCGMPRVVMTSMQRELKKQVSFEDVKRSVVEHFGTIFERTMEAVCSEKII